MATAAASADADPAIAAATTTAATTEFTASTVCFKCAGQGVLHTKKRKRPGMPAVAAGDAADGPVTVLSEGSKAVHLQRSCPVCQGSGRVVSRRKARAQTIEGMVMTGRRPPGFVVKGPLPPAERVAAAQPEPGEALCYLTGDFRIYQPVAGHRFSTDDVVTAWVAGKELRRLLLPPTPGQFTPKTGATEDGSGLRGLDLGTGLGSVLLMLCWQFPALRYVGVEAQRSNAERARRSCWVNGCEGRTEIQHGDIRALFDGQTAGPPPVPEGERGFDIVTGTPPYFDAHGAPAPSDPADPPIHTTALPSSKEDDDDDGAGAGAAGAQARKAASGRARAQPVPLPAAEDQRPCNFELRGGVEVYCRAAKASLAPRGLFVMCASDLPGVDRRVHRAARDAGLVVLRKLAVLPKRGQAPLFAVYTLCHDETETVNAYRLALFGNADPPIDFVGSIDSNRGPPRVLLLVDPPSAAEGEGWVVRGGGDGLFSLRETLAVRDTMPAAAVAATPEGDEEDVGRRQRLPRTAEYRRVMGDMNMPDNDQEEQEQGQGEGEG